METTGLPDDVQLGLLDVLSIDYNDKKLNLWEIPTLIITPGIGKVKFIGMVGLKFIENAI